MILSLRTGRKAIKADRPTAPIAKSDKRHIKVKSAKKRTRKGPIKLTAYARGDVWMDVRADGEVKFHQVLKKGESETWKADDKIKLWVGKAEKLDLTLNGEDLGSPGSGVIKGIIVSAEGLSVKGR